MIALLNYLPFLILAVTLFFAVRFAYAKSFKKTAYTVVAGLIALFAVNALTPSYMPKGTVPDNSVPAFEPSTAEVQNRLREPKPEVEQRQILEEKLDWEEKAEQSKTEDN